MNDKLRELAEWMRDINGHCADALTEILDAEGDGGTVGGEYAGNLWSLIRKVMSQGGDIYLDHEDQSAELYHARLDEAARERVADFTALQQPAYTHPARSGVVSDEDVNRVIASVSGVNIDGMDGDSWDRILVRAAFDFAGKRHD